jgi:hypothetical protein
MDIGVKDGYALSRGGANLIIGGVASTLNTPALIASKFSFNESNIKKMEIVNNDVYLKVNTTYSINRQAFFYNNQITFFQDLGQLCTRINREALSHTGNRLGDFTFYGTFIEGNAFDGYKGTKLIMPNYNVKLEGSRFRDFQCFEFIAPLATAIDYSAFENQFKPTTRIEIPGVTALNSKCFTRFRELNYLDARSVQTIAFDAFNDAATNNGTAFFPIFHATSNNGNPHSSIQFLINKNWTINYV